MNVHTPTSTLEWTEEQRAIIDLPPDARTLVVADAGTGKTAVLIERLASLISLHALAPGTEVLVLSFTRAAVGEIGRRLKNLGGATAYVRASTFDSFATRLLAECAPTGPWQDKGHDDRIKLATGLINDTDEGTEKISEYRHIFIDEIQDLVNPRVEFVEAILDHAAGGFTLFGDPAQAIYGWQNQASAAGPTVFASIRSRFASELIDSHIDGNHRAQSEITRRALSIGAPLGRPDPDYRSIGGTLIQLARELPSIGRPEVAAPQLRRVQSSTAVLCRNNGQALVLSSDLHHQGVPHRLQRRATDRAVGSWVARVFQGVGDIRMARVNILGRIQEETGDSVEDSDERWRLLKRMDPGRGDAITVSALRERMQTGQVPDELTSTPPSDLVVSTIHRAKGLEFESVVVVSPADFHLSPDDNIVAEETRTLYVALTRPRKHLMVMPPGETRAVFLDGYSRRWVRRGFEGWQTFGFEVSGDDIHRAHPAGAFLTTDLDVADTQDYMWNKVHPGDPIELRFIRATVAGKIIAYYSVLHDERPIGVTSEGFSEALRRRLSPRHPPKRWPRAIDDVYIESLDTVAGSRATSENCGLGSAGLWLRPRIVGLGNFSW